MWINQQINVASQTETFTNIYFKTWIIITCSFHIGNLHFPTFPPVLKFSSLNRTLCNTMTLEFCVLLPQRVYPRQGSTPVFRRAPQPCHYGSLSKPVWLSTQRGETSLPDQASSSLAACHPPLCFSQLILLYCSLPFCTHFFACHLCPQRGDLRLPPQRRIALCLLFKLFIKERGRQERNCHSHWFCYVTSVSLCFSPGNAASGQDLSTDMLGTQCCELCENVMIFKVLLLWNSVLRIN